MIGAFLLVAAMSFTAGACAATLLLRAVDRVPADDSIYERWRSQ